MALVRETLAAKVAAIIDNAVPLEADFIALGYDENFIQEMRDRVAAFESAKDEKETGSSGGLGATIREALKATKQLNVLMKKLYKNVPDKLAAWTTAYHTERVGTKKKAEAPQPANA